MIYRVIIGYQNFDIPDDQTAISFAKLAKKYMNIKKTDSGLVYIEILNDEEVATDE